ncbi:hypothetical protein [Saccharopolyspora erythraea]|uniref:hypothetical protein n=1 Tax=Saccharopolyspora erythraea TaxID=1836 RepID=UPI0001D30CAF|nr:hypothetical protein [Saccharopolyspora erythraea]EQD86118.1 hypothetical protein N599_11215 [Saccharopolyspora erythraea D]QRK90803.1 hypothetical protein JQX30_04830 [Saccharopolyspora erythraea]
MGTTVGAVIGCIFYALSVVAWLISVPISAASRLVGIFRGDSPTMQIEHELLGL